MYMYIHNVHLLSRMGTEALLRCQTAPAVPDTREDLAYPYPAAPGDMYGKRTGNDSYSKDIKFYITFLHKSIIIMIIIRGRY